MGLAVSPVDSRVAAGRMVRDKGWPCRLRCRRYSGFSIRMSPSTIFSLALATKNARNLRSPGAVRVVMSLIR